MSLEILYRDEYIVAINKPSGMLVHRSEIDRHETRFVLQLLRNQLKQRVYPVHRLDKPTSGVLVFALSSDIASAMVKQWQQRAVEKRYLAIVRGYMPEFTHLDYAMRPPVDKYARNEVEKPPQEAITDFRRLGTIEIPVAIDKYPQSRYSLVEGIRRLGTIEIPVAIDKYPQSRYSLVEAIPKTGRKHQIRRHLKHLSHPIIGDARYGKGRHSRYFRDHLNAGRLLLHAWKLAILHPVHGTPLTFSAPLDAVFAHLIRGFAWETILPEELYSTMPENEETFMMLATPFQNYPLPTSEVD